MTRKKHIIYSTPPPPITFSGSPPPIPSSWSYVKICQLSNVQTRKCHITDTVVALHNNTTDILFWLIVLTFAIETQKQEDWLHFWKTRYAFLSINLQSMAMRGICNVPLRCAQINMCISNTMLCCLDCLQYSRYF